MKQPNQQKPWENERKTVINGYSKLENTGAWSMINMIKNEDFKFSFKLGIS